MSARVVVLDYGSGNVHSAVRMLERVGADVELTADPAGGAGRRRPVRAGRRQLPRLHARAARGRRAPADRAAAGRRAPGARGLRRACRCSSTGRARPASPGSRGGAGRVARHRSSGCRRRSCRTWGGPRSTSRRARGCSPASSTSGSTSSTPTPRRSGSSRPEGAFAAVAPKVTWAEHGARFVAAVENGPLWATQFHPEKSGDAGAQLLRNWVGSL